MKTKNVFLRMCLVRHAETIENTSRILQGHLPGTLSEKGILQAVNLASELQLDDFDAIVSSDLKRVTDTVKIILGGKEINWYRSPLFREIDWGSMTGMKTDDVDFERLASDVETGYMLYERAKRAVNYLFEHFADKTLLLVSHGLFLRSFVANITNVSIDKLHTIERFKNCERRWIEVEKECNIGL